DQAGRQQQQPTAHGGRRDLDQHAAAHGLPFPGRPGGEPARGAGSAEGAGSRPRGGTAVSPHFTSSAGPLPRPTGAKKDPSPASLAPPIRGENHTTGHTQVYGAGKVFPALSCQ